MNNNGLHRQAVAEAERFFPGSVRQWHRMGLIVDGRVVYVRVARPSPSRHPRPNGKTYEYRLWRWNLHGHTERPATPWRWLLIGIDGRKRRYWLVPGRAMLGHGKTIVTGCDRKRPYAGLLNRYAVTPP